MIGTGEKKSMASNFQTGFKKNIYKEPPNSLSYYLPWAVIIDEDTVVLQKDGLLQKTAAIRGQDLDSASAETIAAVSWQLNNAVKRLGSGWAVFFEAQRYATTEYPGSKHTNRAAFLIDEERRRNFSRVGLHYDSSYYLTLVYKPALEISKKVTEVFTRNDDENSAIDEIKKFKSVFYDIMGILSSRVMVEVLDDVKTLSYLHSAISMNWHTYNKPERSIFLDKILPDANIELGTTLKIDEYYSNIVGVLDYPTETYPGIFDLLNKAEIEFRWVIRFICLDKEDGQKAISQFQKKYYGNRKSFKDLVGEATTKTTNDRINQGAVVLESDAIEAQIELTRDEVSFGYSTVTIQVWDENIKKAKEKATYVAQIINQKGFGAKIETFNCAEAWLGMMPGNVYANIRRPLVSTGNMSQIVPLTAVWSGDIINQHFNEALGDGTPHITCSTNFGTPFYLNLSVGDVMHTFIAGPTGTGKSVLLAMLAIQWLRYRNTKVIIFDKDKSAKQITQAVGGKYYEPGAGNVSFQPLEKLETEEDIIWASEFIELMVELQGKAIDIDIRRSIYDALQILKTIGKKYRTITSLQQYVQSEDVKNALQIYTLNGTYGSIFDNNECSIRDSKWLMIEMDTLMKLGKGAIMPALYYLFHYIESMLDGNPVLLEMDEAWLLMKNPLFERQIQNWLKTFRKKRVAVVFATQEIADAANSEITTTILQQCHTKIYLPDEEAISPVMKSLYEGFGLSEGEIQLIARAKKKDEYLYKSSKGTRLFRLDLGPIALALLTGQNLEYLEKIEQLEDQDLKILESKGLIKTAQEYLEENPQWNTGGLE